MRVQISASEAFAKRKLSHFFVVFVSTSVTLRNYCHAERNYFHHAENYFRHVFKLHTSQQRQPHTNSTCTHARSYYGPDWAVPGIINNGLLIGCIKCMRCRLLLPMITASVHRSVSLSVLRLNTAAVQCAGSSSADCQITMTSLL